MYIYIHWLFLFLCWFIIITIIIILTIYNSNINLTIYYYYYYYDFNMMIMGSTIYQLLDFATILRPSSPGAAASSRRTPAKSFERRWRTRTSAVTVESERFWGKWWENMGKSRINGNLSEGSVRLGWITALQRVPKVRKSFVKYWFIGDKHL